MIISRVRIGAYLIISFLALSSHLFSVNSFSTNNFNLDDRMRYFKVPGLSLAVVDGGDIKATGYGFLDSKGSGSINSETLFQAGEISKPITALAVLKLVEDGVLDLDTDVNNYLKGFVLGQKIYFSTQHVTLRLLLNHTAGINSYGPKGYSKNEELPTLIDMLNGLGNSEKVAVHHFPGIHYWYSWGGYSLIQKIIEDVTGLSFDEYMSENIFKPLGMSRSFFKMPLPKKLQGNVSLGHNLYGESIEGGWRNYTQLAATGLWSTPTDIAKYTIEIQKILAGDYEGIISKKSVENMLVTYEKNWGLGLSTKFEGDATIIRHSGENAGYVNYFISFPYQDKSIVIMTNGENSWKLIMEMLHSIPNYYEWGL